jgi:hypothetical protein
VASDLQLRAGTKKFGQLLAIADRAVNFVADWLGEGYR